MTTVPQQTNKCSKSTIETLEKGVKYIYLVSLMLNLNIFHIYFSNVSLVDFEQVNVYWGIMAVSQEMLVWNERISFNYFFNKKKQLKVSWKVFGNVSLKLVTIKLQKLRFYWSHQGNQYQSSFCFYTWIPSNVAFIFEKLKSFFSKFIKLANMLIAIKENTRIWFLFCWPHCKVLSNSG